MPGLRMADMTDIDKLVATVRKGLLFQNGNYRVTLIVERVPEENT